MLLTEGSMKRIFFFVCLFLLLITSLLSQSNTVLLGNRTPGQRFRAAHAVPMQTSGLSFAPVVTYASGNEPSSVAVADVNGDGKPDLVVVNYVVGNGNGSGSVGVLLGNGDGTFQTAVTYGSGGYEAVSVAVADVNGDGKPDIVVGNSIASDNPNQGSVGVLLGNGDGTFQTAVTYGSGGYYFPSVAVADVNGDGKPDLVVANCSQGGGCGGSSGNGVVGVLLGNGDGTFQTAVAYGSGGLEASSVAVADVNRDGKPDIVVANVCVNDDNCAGTVAVLLGNGDGTFQTAVTYGSGGYEAGSVVVADVNGDGKPDIVVLSVCAIGSSCGVVGVLLGNGDGTFQTAVTYGSGGYGASSVAVADVNGDGKPDIVVTNFGSDTVGVLINTSLGSTTTALTSSPKPSNFGQAVTFTATVTSQGSGTPTGTVTFTYGSTTLCNAVTLSGGTTTCAYSGLPVGSSDTVTATYSGDPNFSGSSGSLNQTVNQATTTTTLTSSLNPSGLDSPVTFTATITPQYGGQATGTVTFKDGGTMLGSTGVSGNAASLTISGLAIGTHSITATYSGDPNFTGSTSTPYVQVVTKATTTTTLASSVNPSVQGKPVTFTAEVSSLAGTPTGKIQFLNGTTVLATKKLTSGSAKFVTSELPPGVNIITAVYEGDSNDSGSTSTAVNQIVLAATKTTLSSSPNPSTYGEAVTFTAVVASGAGTPPDGESVSFMKGKTVLGTGTLSGGSATFTTSTLKIGTTTVEAVYGGDPNFAGSTSNKVKQVVEKAD
jgi:hypothetical protein